MAQIVTCNKTAVSHDEEFERESLNKPTPLSSQNDIGSIDNRLDTISDDQNDPERETHL